MAESVTAEYFIVWVPEGGLEVDVGLTADAGRAADGFTADAGRDVSDLALALFGLRVFCNNLLSTGLPTPAEDSFLSLFLARKMSSTEIFCLDFSPTKLVKLISPILQLLPSGSSPGPGTRVSFVTDNGKKIISLFLIRLGSNIWPFTTTNRCPIP